MSTEFSGSVYRVGQLQTRKSASWSDVPVVHEGFILVLNRTDEMAARFLDRAMRRAERWWLTHRYDFEDASKLRPTLLYMREVPTSTPRLDFVRDYFDAGPLPDDTNFRSSDGPDRSPRGEPRDRQRELDLIGPILGLDSSDPWSQVDLAYEFWWSRALFEVAGGYQETIWFQSTGPADDPLDALHDALSVFASGNSGELVRLIGPVRANEMSGPSTGLLVGRASRYLPGGAEEYEAKYVSLDAWR